MMCENAPIMHLFCCRKPAKSPRKGKKKNVKKEVSVEQIKKDIDIDELNDIIMKLNLVVPGWKEEEPTFKQALFDVFNGVLWGFGEILFQINWVLKYKILKQEYADEDREYLCRKYHKKSELEWETMPEQDRQKLLKKPGQWRRREKGDGRTKGKKKRN